jgi:hypothetical protein
MFWYVTSNQLNSSITLLGRLNVPKGTYSRSSMPKPLGPPISIPRAVEVHFSDAVIPRTITRRPYRYSGVPIASPLCASMTQIKSGTEAMTYILRVSKSLVRLDDQLTFSSPSARIVVARMFSFLKGIRRISFAL